MQLDDDSLLASQIPEQIDAETLAACLQACLACEIACTACVDGCLGEDDLGDLRRCIRLALDCADICAATARVLARRVDSEPKLVRAQVEACARACSTSAGESHRHEVRHHHCRLCAAACRRCAERCGALLRELPDAHGQTHPRQDTLPDLGDGKPVSRPG